MGDQSISSDELERAVASSPFAVQFPTMDQNQQAALRGDVLQRLVASRLLFLEAKRRKLDRTAAFTDEIRAFRTSLLYQAYMDRLRESSAMSDTDAASLRERFRGEPDAAAAAKAQAVADRFTELKATELSKLYRQFHAVVVDKNFTTPMSADTELARFDGGAIRYRDIAGGDKMSRAELKDEVDAQLETLVVARAADAAGIKVDAEVNAYRYELLPALLLGEEEKKWIPNEAAARAHFAKHPEIGQIPAQNHVLQIVVADKEKAEALRKRLLAGENFFQLAVDNTIDPYGRKHAGDMGWLPVGSGMPEVEQAIAPLKDGELSGVIASKRGFHLVKVEERKLAFQKTYEAVADRVRQSMIQAQLPALLQQLSARYRVDWKLPMVAAADTAAVSTEQR